MWKAFRIVLYIFCIVWAIIIWYNTYWMINQLLSFQVEIYSYMIQWQELLYNAWGKAQWVVDSVVWFFSDEDKKITAKELFDGSTRLASFQDLLERISLICWIIAWLITYFILILSRIVFKGRMHIESLKKFIN